VVRGLPLGNFTRGRFTFPDIGLFKCLHYIKEKRIISPKYVNHVYNIGIHIPRSGPAGAYSPLSGVS